MKRYLYRSNNIPMAVLGWKSPNQVQQVLGGRWSLLDAPPWFLELDYFFIFLVSHHWQIYSSEKIFTCFSSKFKHLLCQKIQTSWPASESERSVVDKDLRQAGRSHRNTFGSKADRNWASDPKPSDLLELLRSAHFQNPAASCSVPFLQRIAQRPKRKRMLVINILECAMLLQCDLIRGLLFHIDSDQYIPPCRTASAHSPFFPIRTARKATYPANQSPSPRGRTNASAQLWYPISALPLPVSVPLPSFGCSLRFFL